MCDGVWLVHCSVKMHLLYSLTDLLAEQIKTFVTATVSGSNKHINLRV